MKNKKGFTLIELLVVVAIMGLLTALAIVALNSARARARDARRVSDIKQIQTALELYYLDNNEYPDDDNSLGAGMIIEGKCISSGGGIGTCTGTTYMSLTPSNPKPRIDGNCTDTNYTYTAIATGGKNTSYYIGYCLGAITGGVDDGGHRATPAGLVDD